MWLSEGDKVAAHFLSRTFGKPSGPVEVLGFNVSILQIHQLAYKYH